MVLMFCIIVVVVVFGVSGGSWYRVVFLDKVVHQNKFGVLNVQKIYEVVNAGDLLKVPSYGGG
jgi:hypothetical protein